jgi:hypothetical protein
MAKLDELAHFDVGQRPVLASVASDKPLNVRFHDAHDYFYHEPPSAVQGAL